ncbi:MAG TPA: hypothetical protein VGH07_01065, partial [Chthoniobacterales bacterium]
PRPALNVEWPSEIGIDLLAYLLGTEEGAAILGRENRMNQEMGEGLPHSIITTCNCVIVNKLGRPFRAGLWLRIAPRAKARLRKAYVAASYLD